MTTDLDRKSLQPLYMQLVNELRGVVESMPADARFPTEREISEQYGVSRFTVVKAVNQLAQEGHLYRIQGRGTFRGAQPAAHPAERKTALFFLAHALTELVSRNDYIMAEMAQGVIDSLGREANLVLAPIPRDEDETRFCAERISHPSTDGMILFPWMNIRALVRLATNLRKPFVLLNVKHDYALAHNAILADEAEGARLLTRYLLDQGHRAIAYVTTEHHKAQHNPDLVLTDRFAGYHRALEEAGVPFDPGLVTRWRGPQADADVTAIEDLVRDEARRPTALFVANDLVAEKVLAMLRRRGLRVPEDISVVGYDDAPCSARTAPPLTTVRKPRYEMGVAAGELLLKMLREGFSLGATEVLKTEPVIRESAGPIPAACAAS